MTLSREDLYELVWSKPMTELAKDFGISDVALAKRCKRLGIPAPGRGYWARIDAGQTPYRPKLPKREPQWHDDSALRVAPSAGAYGATILSSENTQETLTSAAPDSVPARIAALTITSTTSILDALPAVKRTAVRTKHPLRSELTFERGERTGAAIDVRVTQEVLERALLLADTMLRAAASLGWIFGDPADLCKNQEKSVADSRTPGPPKDPGEAAEQQGGRLLIEGEEVALRIEERFRDEAVEPSAAQLAREKREYGYHAPRKVPVATGALRIVRLDTYGTWGEPDRRSWYDRKGRRVEDQIPEILLGFYELSLSIRERREKAEREARKREEEERRRKEREAIQEANEKLVKQLETDSGAWHRAQYLRRYIRAARRRLGSQVLHARFRDQTVNFLEWAEAYVDQLDPLGPRLRTGEFDASSTYHYQADLDRMKNAFGRLLGADWPYAFKVGKDYVPEPNPDRCWYSREKSVFEVGSPESGDED